MPRCALKTVCICLVCILLSVAAAAQLRNNSKDSIVPPASSYSAMPHGYGITPGTKHFPHVRNHGAFRMQDNSPAYPVDDCITRTFRLQIGDDGYDTRIEDLLTVSNGNTWQVGYTSKNSNDHNALLQLMDMNGALLWSKTLLTIGLTDRFYSIAEAPDGNLVLAGTLQSPNASVDYIVIVLTDANGNINWCRMIQPGLQVKEVKVVASVNNEIGFTATDGQTIVYSRLDYSGNVRWLRQLQLPGNCRLVGLTDYFNRWFIGYTREEAGRYTGGILFTDPFDGAITESVEYGGAASNSDFIFHDMQINNLRPRLTGIYSLNNGPWQLCRVSLTAGSTPEPLETFTTPGINFDVTASSVQTRWAEVIVFKNSGASADFYAMHATPDFAIPNPVRWKRRFSGIGQYELKAADRSFDGGNIIAINHPSASPGMQHSFLVKTDSAGLSPACAGANFPVQHTHAPVSVTRPGYTAGLFTADVIDELFSWQPVIMDTVSLCRSTYCPPRPVEDTCAYSFYRSFRSTHFCDIAREVSPGPGNDVLITGHMRNNPYNPESDYGIMLRFNEKGKLVARKKLFMGGATTISKHFRAANGSVITLGHVNNNGKLSVAITKFDPALNMLWHKLIEVNNITSEVYRLLESADGSIFLWFRVGNQDFFNQELNLLKLDAAGNFVWMKNYKTGNTFVTSNNGDMVQDEQYLYTVNDARNDPVGTLVMKIDKTSGNLLWAKNLKGTGNGNLAFSMQLLGRNLLLFGYSGSINGAATALLVLDKDGNVIKTKSYAYNSQLISHTMLVTRNTEIVLTGVIYDQTLAPHIGFSSFLRLDSNLNILHNKRTFIDNAATVTDLAESPGGGIYETGFFYYSNPYNNDLYLKKYTDEGDVGNCPSDIGPFTEGAPVYTITDINMMMISGSVMLKTAAYSEDNYSLQQNRLVCSSPPACTSLELTGPEKICDSTGHYEFRTTRDLNCTAPVAWIYDPEQAELIAANDTTAIIRIRTNGIIKLKAKLFSGCSWYEDSVLITATIAPGTPDLGPDTSICENNTLLLNAGRGFDRYLWQDGSTDSLFTVTGPGKYFVTASDACGYNFADTVEVLATAPIPFNIGGTITICANDSATISAPSGFLQYNWSPSYNIDTTGGVSVTVFPLKDTLYHVAAEKTPGCFAYDSIRIAVNHSAGISLGNDSSLCAGDSILLDAGPGFLQYQWNTGHLSAAITVGTKGIYSVTATDVNGCQASDTLEVINVFNNPLVQLPDDSLLCAGEDKLLDAGSGFIQYLWQDGSGLPQFTATYAGIYYVQVTDVNGCTGSDTTQIARIQPLPANFLAADTSICRYARLSLAPSATFNSYSWNNGSDAREITITQPGIYSLTVKDDFGCQGTDQVIVNLKDCLKGFFVPNAFTPNTNGKNDVFRPLVPGPVIQYEFAVYNRWGQRIFHTTDRNAGWDGTIAGKPQDSNVYVWTCIYQFENEPVRKERGIVTLIR